jgi:DNA-binding CsgD family transcriptional regulator/N-acetylneuraminic acid mutarotase
VSEELVPLSEREMELLQLLATGATNQQIAQELVISVNTVKVHLRNIYTKLGVASRTEATMVAVREGWLEVPRADGAQAEAAAATMATAPTSPLPSPEQWMQVPLFKRVALVVAMLITLAAFALPLVLEGRASDEASDPISGVFPTAPPGPPSTRWHTRAQMPTPRTNLAVVPHEGLIYAIGGVSNDGVTGKVEVYDPEADAWSIRRTKPTPAGFVSAVEVGDRIYVPGGIDPEQQALDLLEVYDPAQDAWQRLARLPVPLGAYGLAALDDQIYLFGGLSGQEYLASVYRYDPEDDRWEALEPMEVARGFLSAATVGDRIYVAGGYDDVDEFDRLDAYDPATGDWAALQPMALPRGGLALVTVRDQLYAIGGGLDRRLAFNERYDSSLDAWSTIETPVKGQWQGLGAAFVGSNIYAIGGWSDGNLSVNEAYQALFQSLVPLAP